MERLTKRRADSGEPYICTIEGVNNAVARLAAYEDTELEPEEITVQLEILRRYFEAADGIGLKRLRELSKAEKDGRLVVLPCRLGDFVYDIDFKKNNIILSKVAAVFVTETEAFPGVLISLELIAIDGERPGEMHYVYADDIGKTWFLTRQEAEEALRDGGANHEPSR